jgi:predicted cobalt transporter CbtA
MSPLLRLVGRGAFAGVVAGLLSAVVSFLLGEPSVRRAVELEEVAAHTAGHAAGQAEHAEVFSRTTQQGALFLVSMLTGLALGILFALVYALWQQRDPDADSWRRSILLAIAGLVGIALIPFLRYPANPPAVGDPASVDARTTAYLTSILIGLVAVTAAVQVHRRLADRGVRPSLRQLAALGVVVVGLAATWLLPGTTEVVEVPADLIWNFRLASIATLVVLWLGLGAIFGLLGERAERGVASEDRSSARPS